MQLTQQEKERYARHISLNEIGIEGQMKLKTAKILIVGIGGLGSPLALYLSAAGVGTIGIIDNDVVSESNLQRQILYNINDIKLPKVEIAKRKLKALNPYIKIESYYERLTKKNALHIIKEYDIIVDGCDNLYTRYIINDACIKLNRPYVYGAISEFSGQISVFNYNGGATYRCLYPYYNEIKNFTQVQGVLGVLPGIVATIQANEVIKIICKYGNILTNKLLLIDSLNTEFQTINIRKINTNPYLLLF